MGCSKGLLQGKFVAPTTYIRKGKSSQISDLSFHLKSLEKGRKNKGKSKQKNGNNKNQGRNHCNTEKQWKNQTKSWFFENIDFTATSLTRMTREKEKTYIANTSNGRQPHYRFHRY